jgi:hypothetical protein
LHVLGTPPAFILSQDQTHHSLVCVRKRPLTAEKTTSTELTETASTNSCCSVFHSSIVKVYRAVCLAYRDFIHMK